MSNYNGAENAYLEQREEEEAEELNRAIQENFNVLYN
jgi:hypothetical protein